jgi:hypothetical protein
VLGVPVALGFIAPASTVYALALEGTIELPFIQPATIVVRPELRRDVVNVLAPQVRGEIGVGLVLECWPGVWEGPPRAITFQWQRDTGAWEDIAGATQSTYLLQPDDLGLEIRCAVTASL